MCHNLNWQKANDKHMDYCLTYQMDVAPATWKAKKSNKSTNGKPKE
jgi:hypothetical protein